MFHDFFFFFLQNFEITWLYFLFDINEIVTVLSVNFYSIKIILKMAWNLF